MTWIVVDAAGLPSTNSPQKLTVGPHFFRPPWIILDGLKADTPSAIILLLYFNDLFIARGCGRTRREHSRIDHPVSHHGSLFHKEIHDLADRLCLLLSMIQCPEPVMIPPSTLVPTSRMMAACLNPKRLLRAKC